MLYEKAAQDPMDADAHAMVQVQRGDLEAFEGLVRRCQGPLYAFFVRLGGSAADAEDLVQETLLRVYKARESFDPRRAFTPWLFGIARYVWADYGRQRERAQATTARAVQELAVSEAVTVRDAGEQALRPDVIRCVRESLHQLPEDHRLVLILRHYQGLRYDEIAQALGLSVGTVKSRMHYALAKLRVELRRRGLLEA